MFVTSAMRRIKRKAASTMPTSMATVRSTRTVSRKVVSSTATSLFGARNSEMNVRHSLMWKATTTRIAASVARGMSAAQRPKKSVIRSSVMAWVIPAAGVDRAEPRANRLDRQVQQLREGRGDDQRDKRARYPRRDPRPDGDDRQRRNRDHQRPRVDRLKSVDVRVPLRQERRGHSLHL